MTVSRVLMGIWHESVRGRAESGPLKGRGDALASAILNRMVRTTCPLYQDRIRAIRVLRLRAMHAGEHLHPHPQPGSGPWHQYVGHYQVSKLSLAVDFVVQGDGAYTATTKYGPVIVPHLEFGHWFRSCWYGEMSHDDDINYTVVIFFLGSVGYLFFNSV